MTHGVQMREVFTRGPRSRSSRHARFARSAERGRARHADAPPDVNQRAAKVSTREHVRDVDGRERRTPDAERKEDGRDMSVPAVLAAAVLCESCVVAVSRIRDRPRVVGQSTRRRAP